MCVVESPVRCKAHPNPLVVEQDDVLRRIGEDGLQGVVQNVAGAAWFLAMGSLLRRHRPALGATAIAVGAFLVVNAAGIMVDVEALRFIGLTGHVLLHSSGLSASAPRSCDHPERTRGRWPCRSAGVRLGTSAPLPS